MPDAIKDLSRRMAALMVPIEVLACLVDASVPDVQRLLLKKYADSGLVRRLDSVLTSLEFLQSIASPAPLIYDAERLKRVLTLCDRGDISEVVMGDLIGD